ncbi:hypothetical protein F5Y12DRAFT_731981, partial [Xylaria sp. FL1777]
MVAFKGEKSSGWHGYGTKNGPDRNGSAWFGLILIFSLYGQTDKHHMNSTGGYGQGVRRFLISHLGFLANFLFLFSHPSVPHRQMIASRNVQSGIPTTSHHTPEETEERKAEKNIFVFCDVLVFVFFCCFSLLTNHDDEWDWAGN